MYFIFKDDLILNGQINSEGCCFSSMYYFVYKVLAACPPLEILPFLTQLNSRIRVQQQLCSLLHLLSAPGSPKLLHSSFLFVAFPPFLAPLFFPIWIKRGRRKANASRAEREGDEFGVLNRQAKPIT